MGAEPDDLRTAGRLFVWTLLGGGLAALVLFAIISMRLERVKFVDEKQETSGPVQVHRNP